jgi:prevent-host-death family protein
MRTMAAGEFKAKCLAVMAEVNSTGQPVLVTKRGKPLARVLPFEELSPKESPEAIFGCLREFLAAPDQVDDLAEPFIPVEEWDHLKEDWSPMPPE